MQIHTSLLLATTALLTACASNQPAESGVPSPVDRANLPFSSPECLAAKLPPGEPFPATAIPPAALASRQSGLIAIRYDVVAGAAQNLQVVKSSPAGLYDSAALQHVSKYRASPSSTVRGCVTVIDIKF
jgi:outer membrane biosynthesis protein TonB